MTDRRAARASSDPGDGERLPRGDDRGPMGDSTQLRYQPRELLALLAESDEQTLRAVLAPTPEFTENPGAIAALERRTRVLVRLAALIALNASTTTLRW